MIEPDPNNPDTDPNNSANFNGDLEPVIADFVQAIALDHCANSWDEEVNSVDLEGLQTGDNLAWERFLNDWQTPIYHHLCLALADPGIALDVLQDTFESAVLAIRSFDGEQPFSTFVYTLASLRIANYDRSQTTASSNFEPSNSSTNAFWKRWIVLRPRSREALSLRYNIGISEDEIAQIFGLSIVETASLLRHSRQQLQTNMEGPGHDE